MSLLGSLCLLLLMLCAAGAFLAKTSVRVGRVSCGRFVVRHGVSSTTPDEETSPMTDPSNLYDWSVIDQYFDEVIGDSTTPPSFLSGTSEYGVTDLSKIEACGVRSGEFTSNDNRYTKRQTFALRIGYKGLEYLQGFQAQTKDGRRSVEADMKEALQLGSRIIGAGRTDGKVSAISQICNVISGPSHTPESILAIAKQSEAAQEGRLVFYDCKRVPRSFNARSNALWRRYCYLVPLDSRHQDIDVSFLNEVLNTIENKQLPYNAFAFQTNYKKGEGEKDLCIMYVANAQLKTISIASKPGESIQTICIELVGNRFLRRMVRLLVSTAIREAALPHDERRKGIIEELCLADDKESRQARAAPYPGNGLVFAGVGFSEREFSFYKHQPKAKRKEVLEYYGMKEEE